MNPGGDDPEEGGRWGATLGGAVAVIAVIALGIWLMDELADNVRYAKCAQARHRNCDAIDYRSAPSPQ